jgi:hypothetical protein
MFHRNLTAVLGVGTVAFLIAATISWIVPFVPRVHDEFSYLLAADTLLHGRLANPTPQVWQPFQSFHILLEPSYASKYPLGLGACVALGWLLFGQPIAGCWLAAGMCAAAMTWMLAGVTGRRWAILGGLLVACHPAMQVVWSQTLMSGWLTAAGSALLMGGIVRLRRRFQWMAALGAGAGVGMLALTRPYEGLVATLLASSILWLLWRARPMPFQQQLSIAVRAIPVAAIPLTLALIAIGLQNVAVTGHLTRMSYQVHEQQYGVAPLFVFGQQHLPQMEAEGELPTAIRDYHYGWSLDSFVARAGLRGWLLGIMEIGWTMWGFWVLLAIVPVLTAGHWRRYRLTGFMAGAVIVQILLSALVCWVFPHYLSPMLPWLVVLTTVGLRRIFRSFVHVNLLRMSQPRRFVAAILTVQLLLLVINAVHQRFDPVRGWAERRAAIAAQLSAEPGHHLVLVQYAPEHNVHQEWVYNLADLEGGKVLWARGERDEWNANLSRQYQRSHTIWKLRPDATEAELELLSKAEY